MKQSLSQERPWEKTKMIKNNRKKINRRGSLSFFGDHALGLFVGVICFVILVFAAVQVYGFFQDQSDLQKAEKYVEVIKTSLSDAKNNLKHESVAEVFGPTEWWVISWPYKNQIEKPYLCKGFSSCICICATGSGIENSLSQCNSYGKCIGVDGNIKTIYRKPVSGWFSGILKGASDMIYGENTEIPIPIEKPPIELKIKYDKDNGYEVTAE